MWFTSDAWPGHRLVAPLGQCVPRLADIGGRDWRRGIAPGIANIGNNGGNLIVRQHPGELRHRRCGRRAVGGGAARAPQHDMQQRRWIALLDNRRSVERWKETGRPLAVRGMTARALVRIDRAADPHRFFVRLDHGLGVASGVARLIFQISRDGLEISIAQVRRRQAHHFGHQARSGARAVMPGFQIGYDLLDRPTPDAAARVAGNVRREPSLQSIAV